MAWLDKDVLEGLYWKHNLTAKEIGQHFNCSDAWIRHQMRFYAIPMRTKSEAFKLKYDKKPHLGFIVPDLAPSEYLSYILGVMIGDGWAYKNRYNYIIGLTATSDNFVNCFAYSLRAIGLHPAIRKDCKSVKNKKWQDQYRLVADSKKFYEWFVSLCLIDIKNLIQEYEKDFVRGFYDSEGNLSKRTKNCWRVTIYNSDKQIIALVRKVIEGMKFKTSVSTARRANKKPEYQMRILGGMKETQRFLNMIRPTIKGE